MRDAGEEDVEFKQWSRKKNVVHSSDSMCLQKLCRVVSEKNFPGLHDRCFFLLCMC